MQFYLSRTSVKVLNYIPPLVKCFFHKIGLNVPKDMSTDQSYSLHLCRSDTSRSELAELSKQANPDEIDIDDDDEDDDDEDQGPDGEWPSLNLKQKHLVSVKRFMQTCFIHDHASVNCLLLWAFTEVQLEQKSVPTAVFGGLKDDWKRHSFGFLLLTLNRLLFTFL